jgi:hypothetical protein
MTVITFKLTDKDQWSHRRTHECPAGIDIDTFKALWIATYMYNGYKVEVIFERHHDGGEQ